MDGIGIFIGTVVIAVAAVLLARRRTRPEERFVGRGGAAESAHAIGRPG